VIARKTNSPKAEKKKVPEMPSARQKFEAAMAFVLSNYELSPAVLAEARRLARSLGEAKNEGSH
jgi:hypothetical protein